MGCNVSAAHPYVRDAPAERRLPAKIVLVPTVLTVDAQDLAADWQMPLTEVGIEQARRTGRLLRAMSGPQQQLLVYCSPYRRCQQALAEILDTLGVKDEGSCIVCEDVRLREQDFGSAQRPSSDRCSQFFYRFPSGESAADVHDRTLAWLEHFDHEMEQGGLGDKDTTILICTHGLTSRVLLMSWFKWSIEQFEASKNPENGQLLIMERDDRPVSPSQATSPTPPHLSHPTAPLPPHAPLPPQAGHLSSPTHALLARSG